MTPEQKEQFKKGKIEECDEDIKEIKQIILDLKNQRDKELERLEDKLDSLKYQKELYG